MADDSYNWGVDLDALLPGDVSDALKMQATNETSAPWWQDAIKYGVTRLIDNKFGPKNKTSVQGNVDPGSFAGANGQTYSQEVAKRGEGQPLQGNPDAIASVGGSGGGASWSNMGMVIIAGIAVAAFIALRSK